MSATAVNSGEHEAIANIIRQYVNGGKSGRGDEMKPAFHPGASSNSVSRPNRAISVLILRKSSTASS